MQGSMEKSPERRPERLCRVCQKPVRGRRDQIYCSAECRKQGWNIDNPPGMTLRQKYAMAAMQARLSAFAYVWSEINLDKVAIWAFQVADAMIEGEKNGKK